MLRSFTSCEAHATRAALARFAFAKNGLAWVVSNVAALSMAGCERSGDDPRRAAPEHEGTSLAGQVTRRTPLVVLAASSLTDAFAELERNFEARHPDVEVALSFGGSQLLKLQIEQGAPGDVFASADEAHMRALVEAGQVRGSRAFAQSELVVVVPEDNPARISSLEDLALAERLVIGSPSVPVGAYTRELLRRSAGRYGAEFESSVRAAVVSEESNVRLVRAKVELGEADAAIVYRTDALASKRVHVVSIPAELNVRASYFTGVLAAAPQAELGGRWVDYLLGPEGRAVLSAHGFRVEE